MLRVAFSREELTFLEGHPRFQRLLKECDGSDASAHALVKEGGALIQKHYGGNPILACATARKREPSLNHLV